MRVDSDLGYQSDTDGLGIETVLEHPIRNAVMFTVMRLVRFVLTLVCEAVALAGAVLVGSFGFLLAMFLVLTGLTIACNITQVLTGQPQDWSNWYFQAIAFLERTPHQWLLFLIKYPFLVVFPAFALLTVAWGQALALGVPYRWRNLPPGLNVVKCPVCSAKMLDVRILQVPHKARRHPGYLDGQCVHHHAVGGTMLCLDLWVLGEMTGGYTAV